MKGEAFDTGRGFPFPFEAWETLESGRLLPLLGEGERLPSSLGCICIGIMTDKCC